MRRVAEETRIYEGLFLVGNKQAKEDLDGVMKEITSYIEETGAEIINCGKWDERRLAYQVSGERRGSYILCHFEARPDTIRRIERSCQISQTVLRALIVRDTDGVEIPPPGQGVPRKLPPGDGEDEKRGEPAGTGARTGERTGGESDSGGGGEYG